MTVSDSDHRTALHIAVHYNQENFVKYLLNKCGLTNEAGSALDRYSSCYIYID